MRLMLLFVLIACTFGCGQQVEQVEALCGNVPDVHTSYQDQTPADTQKSIVDIVPPAPFPEMTEEECVELCDIFWIGLKPVEKACMAKDNCIALCVELGGSDASIEELENCVQAGVVQKCETDPENWDVPACVELSLVFLPPGDTLIQEIDQTTARILCNHFVVRCNEKDRDRCLLTFRLLPCWCSVDLEWPTNIPPKPSVAVCTETVAGTIAGIEGTEGAEGCNLPFPQTELANPKPHQDLVDLSCEEVWGGCVRAMPKQWLNAQHPGCRQRAHDNPVQVCVSAIQALQYGCDAGFETQCDEKVNNLQVCVEKGKQDDCPSLSDGSCLAPWVSQPSGVADDTPIGDLPNSILEEWCSWHVGRQGGEGLPSGCYCNLKQAAVPSVEECQTQLKKHFSECGLSLADIETCVWSFSTWDPCHRLSNFSCADDSDWEDACHLLWWNDCSAITECLDSKG